MSRPNLQWLKAVLVTIQPRRHAAGKDIGKPGKMFSKIAASAGKRYGNKEAGERVAGAVLNKLRSKNESTDQDGDVMDYLNDKLKDFDAQQSKTDESALQAYLGKKKYGETGMKALQKAGREGASKETMARIRARHDKMDEADMEEGNKFTGNLMKARAAGLKKADLDGDGDMETVREADVVGLGEKKKAKPDYIDLDKDGNRKETMKKAAADKKKSHSAGTAFDPEVAKSMFATKDEHPRYDVKDTGYSKRYTRKPEPEAETDDEVSDQPKKKGRPAGTKRAIGAKGPTGRSKLMSKDSIKEMDSVALTDKGEYDQEGDMARDQLHTLVKAAKELHGILADDDNLPEWVQSKITKALDYIKTANDYMDQEKHDADSPIAEKAVSVAQRRAAGIAHAAQKGEIPKKELRGASKEMAKMPKGELKKFAKTKETGLPEKVKEADADAPKEKKSSGGFQFGKGVYESMNKQYTQMLNEGMNISVNMNTSPDGQPGKNITISADGDDADKLAALLKMAGISGHGNAESCDTCGKAPCGCEELDENSPDWPTNTETSDNALQYSGGLNGPKSTGQTTVPVVASQLRRQVSMEESVELENNLLRLYQNYKAQ
jgi:flagellar hook-basal body complex protein FliE